MAKLTLAGLREIREREAKKIGKREIHGRDVHVIVAMGTSGIQSGAKVILNYIADIVEEKGLDNVIITQTGAFDGVVEPVVQVYSKALGLVSYQGVDKDTAKRIVEETIIGGKILEDKKIEIKDGE